MALEGAEVHGTSLLTAEVSRKERAGPRLFGEDERTYIVPPTRPRGRTGLGVQGPQTKQAPGPGRQGRDETQSR